jgi:2-polyprenyl-3-methyl-5-hydroxy-6-metoxy-1,4-benzoquinol methylase
MNTPFFKRLIFPLKIDTEDMIESNQAVRKDIIEKTNTNEIPFINNNCILSDKANTNDLLVATTDRYGIPINTILNLENGLIRADPYYTKEWLQIFYKKYYRDLYTNGTMSNSKIVIEQISRGESYLSIIEENNIKFDTILDYGCGMGGMLIPFGIRGYKTYGIDYGEDYIEIGKKIGINKLYIGGIDELINENKKFDLIILSHIIEHIPDLNLFLNKIHLIMNPGAHIFIAVPGIDNIHIDYKSNFLLYLQSAHCWYFTKNTLTAVLNKFNFEIKHINDEITCLACYNNNLNRPINLYNEAQRILIKLKYYESNRVTSKFKIFIQKLLKYSLHKLK